MAKFKSGNGALARKIKQAHEARIEAIGKGWRPDPSYYAPVPPTENGEN